MIVKETDLRQKQEKLVERLKQLGSVIVAFSGGVDSAYLAYVANRALGERALSVTAFSPSVPMRQRQEAISFAQQFGINHKIIFTEEVDKPEYRKNAPNRCYFCKSELYTKLTKLAQELGYKAVVDGTNLDDIGDYRPGRQAASELGVISPLVEAGMRKQDIRALSRMAGLPTWDKPASPCLSSRIAYGIEVTVERLSMIEQGEEILKGLGFKVFRVRFHGELVRLEFARDELQRALNLQMAELLAREFKKLGFKYVTIDLEGYRTGAMNEILR